MTARAIPAENDPDLGYFKRKAARLARLGIVAIGPSAPPAPASTPTRADEIAQAKRDKQAATDHEKIVRAEIDALDRHAADVTRRIEALESTSRAPDYALQELQAERRQCRELRAMLEDDRNTGPIRADRDGRLIDARLHAIIRMRAREIAANNWAAAARADGAGQRREARQLRVDALRARHLAEFELKLRNAPPGYGLAPWN